MERITNIETLASNRVNRARAYRAACLAELNARVGDEYGAVALSLALAEIWQDSADDMWISGVSG